MELPAIKLGISRCLLGENVRYDGGHKLDSYLRDTLGKCVRWVPVCPEVECGLGVPREPMRLVGTPDKHRLLTVMTRVDHTRRMTSWIDSVLPRLEEADLCGFVFKSRSPSSAMRDARIYSESGRPSSNRPGMFAAAFMRRFPMVPVEDEGRLHDESVRGNFIERVFTYARWKDFIRAGASAKRLVEFHTRHKLLLMAHSPAHYRELGRLTARKAGLSRKELLSQYCDLMTDGMRLIATVKKNTNVLYHIAGYFKKQLSVDEKRELSEVIQNYHDGLVPLVVPLVLLRHYTRKYAEPYLMQQYYLNPHPVELKLRNHA
jgi:uncharacterized protein YbgA (DUF1722 family)/uncharacterized protein YbbK (DUF523 family)